MESVEITKNGFFTENRLPTVHRKNDLSFPHPFTHFVEKSSKIATFSTKNLKKRLWISCGVVENLVESVENEHAFFVGKQTQKA